MEQVFNIPVDGEKAPDPEAVIMQMLQQYATVGMLKKDKKKYILVTCGMIDTVEVEIPSILVANMGEITGNSLLL